MKRFELGTGGAGGAKEMDGGAEGRKKGTVGYKGPDHRSWLALVSTCLLSLQQFLRSCAACQPCIPYFNPFVLAYQIRSLHYVIPPLVNCTTAKLRVDSRARSKRLTKLILNCFQVVSHVACVARQLELLVRQHRALQGAWERAQQLDTANTALKCQVSFGFQSWLKRQVGFEFCHRWI